jgi:hypothetical protein
VDRSSTTPDAFIASLPDPQRDDVASLDRVIAEEMAGLDRVLWEGVFWGGSDQRIIGYGADRYTNRSGKAVDWFLVGLAQQKDHLTVYVNAVEDGAYLIKSYADRLGRVKVGSAAVTFRRASDLDLEVLRELLRRVRSIRGV